LREEILNPIFLASLPLPALSLFLYEKEKMNPAFRAVFPGGILKGYEYG
jgi:hypothetical protein